VNAEPLRGRALRNGTALVFAVSAVLFFVVVSRFRTLYDTDSYYHLAVARAYAQGGMLHDFPWARFSLLTEGFGDKELGFHLLLAPFVVLWKDATTGGKAALVLLNAATAAFLGWLAMRAIGRWGALVPFWLFATAAELPLRTLRLRPELLSLLLFLAALEAFSRRRPLLLGVLAFVYVCSYVAFHVFLGLCVLWFLRDLVAERRREWRMVLYPMLGASLALVVHPHFPRNLRIWFFQSVEFFRYKDALDVGPEIHSQILYNFLSLNAGWLLGLAVLWRSRAETPAAPDETRHADMALVATAGFGALYAFSMRFSIYFLPFATVALLLQIARLGGLGRMTRLPFRGSVPFAAAFLACFLLVPHAAKYVVLNLTSAGVLRKESHAEWRRIADLLPPGAKVAASWGDADRYVFWAPQARYLNVLDPGLMAVPLPKQYNAQHAIFAGEEPDVPLALRMRLDSDFLVFSLEPQLQRLAERLAADPRIEKLHEGHELLVRAMPGANRSFLLDWRISPAGSPWPPPQGASIDGWPVSPRASGPARDFEGYVDATRVLSAASAPCTNLVHEETLPQPARVTYELAPWGPAALFVDGRWLASVEGRPEAVLGKGVLVPIELSAGRHVFAVSTCAAGRRNGFYLVERRR
jgi:hypothetical protein